MNFNKNRKKRWSYRTAHELCSRVGWSMAPMLSGNPNTVSASSRFLVPIGSRLPFERTDGHMSRHQHRDITLLLLSYKRPLWLCNFLLIRTMEQQVKQSRFASKVSAIVTSFNGLNVHLVERSKEPEKILTVTNPPGPWLLTETPSHWSSFETLGSGAADME